MESTFLAKNSSILNSMYISHNNYDHLSSWCTGSDDLDPENVLWSYLKCARLCLWLQHLDFLKVWNKPKSSEVKNCLLFTANWASQLAGWQGWEKN